MRAYPFALDFSAMAARPSACSRVHATSRAPVRSTAIPVRSAYSRSSALPRATSRLSRVPGVASNPVCRMAVFALDVPVPTSSAASIRTQRNW